MHAKFWRNATALNALSFASITGRVYSYLKENTILLKHLSTYFHNMWESTHACASFYTDALQDLTSVFWIIVIFWFTVTQQ